MLAVRSIDALKPRERPYKVADGGGLHLLVSTTGARLWRFRYRYGGKAQEMALGAYPEVSAREARDARDAARADLRAGRDPAAAKRAARQPPPAPALAETFRAVAADWLASNAARWTPRHGAQLWRELEAHVLPVFGDQAIASIKPQPLLARLRGVAEAHGTDLARRLRARCSLVFRHAVATGIETADPAAMIGPALPTLRGGSRPAVVTLDDARAVLARVEAQPASAGTLAAHRLLALTGVRPGEVIGARWAEMELDAEGGPVWRIPAARMKMRKGHIVPLSAQAVALLNALRPLTGRTAFLFPHFSDGTRPMARNTLTSLLVRAGLGGQHCPHGWRSAFSSVMNETCPEAGDVIERCLAHAPANKTRSIYNRSELLPQRRALLQRWADMLLPPESA